jgi:hypothetical protein
VRETLRDYRLSFAGIQDNISIRKNLRPAISEQLSFPLSLRVKFPLKIMRFIMNKNIRNPRFPFQVITSHKSNVFICMLFLTEERAMTPSNLRAVMLFLLPRIKKCLSLLRCRFLSSNNLFYLTYPPPLLVFENHIIHIVRKDKVVHTATIELKMAILLSRIIKPHS